MKRAEDTHRSLDRWEIFGICLGIAGVMVLGFALYQVYLLLVDIINL